MTDDHRFDLAPRAEFADGLERDLLRAIDERTTPREDTIVHIETRPASNHPSRTPWIVAAAAVVFGVIGVTFAVTRDQGSSAPVSSVSPVSPPTTVSTDRSVTFTIDWPGAKASIDCAKTSALVCLDHLPIPSVASFKGDVDGTSFVAAFWDDADVDARNSAHREYIATYMVSGTVKGCGTGRFMLEEYLQDTWPDGHEDQVMVRGTWTVVPESGRSELASLTGQGTSTGGSDGPRTLTGTVNCG